VNKLTNEQTLRVLLYAGAGYFLGVSIVHMLGLKIPGLFVYFNVPSYAYQDRIISFLAFGWSAFFYLAGKRLNADLIKTILLIGLVALIVLYTNTFITDFSQMDNSIERNAFIWITSSLFFYWLSLVIFSRK